MTAPHLEISSHYLADGWDARRGTGQAVTYKCLRAVIPKAFQLSTSSRFNDVRNPNSRLIGPRSDGLGTPNRRARYSSTGRSITNHRCIRSVAESLTPMSSNPSSLHFSNKTCRDVSTCAFLRRPSSPSARAMKRSDSYFNTNSPVRFEPPNFVLTYPCCVITSSFLFVAHRHSGEGRNPESMPSENTATSHRIGIT